MKMHALISVIIDKGVLRFLSHMRENYESRNIWSELNWLIPPGPPPEPPPTWTTTILIGSKIGTEEKVVFN